MTPLEAHEAFCGQLLRGDNARWPGSPRPAHLDEAVGPLFIAALVALHGRLADCTTDDDLIELSHEVIGLIRSGVLTADDWDDAVRDLLQAMHDQYEHLMPADAGGE